MLEARGSEYFPKVFKIGGGVEEGAKVCEGLRGYSSKRGVVEDVQINCESI